jgi:hypothetical protein
MNRQIAVAVVGAMGVFAASHPGGAGQRPMHTPGKTVTPAQILAAHGRPGDYVQTRSGMTYRILPSGLVEIRDPKYGTVKYYMPEPSWKTNLKDSPHRV